MDRTERQKESLKKWLKAGGIGTCVLATGFGKTFMSLNLITAFVKRDPTCSILVVVPTDFLREQWEEKLRDWCLSDNVRVEIINTVVKHNWIYNLLIIDEAHLVASTLFQKVFNCVKYDNILCLTGTLERLDGKEEIIKHYAPVCDYVSTDEAVENGWIAPVKEYLVLLDVDLSEYNELSKTFNQCFAYFNFDFNVAMSASTNKIFARSYAKKMGLDWKQVIGIAQKWGKCMRARKAFIQGHPKKFEVAKKILNARKDKKCITFSATIKQAESFGVGYVIHSKQKDKDNKAIIEKFKKDKCGVLCTSKAANQGVDIPGLSVGIILSVDSSKITKQQRKGRICRLEEGKNAELFTLVLRGTQEYQWAVNSATSSYITLTEEQLDRVLSGEEVKTRERENVANIKYRY